MVVKNRIFTFALAVLIISTNFTISSVSAANESDISKFLNISGVTTKLVFDKTNKELLFEDTFSKYTNDAAGLTDFNVNWDIDSNHADFFGNKAGEGMYINGENGIVLQWSKGMAIRRTEMYSNTLTTFQVNVNEGRLGWGFGIDNANNRAGYAIRQSEEIGASSLYESDFAANPKADSKHLALEGVIFEFDIADIKDAAQGSALVIVVKSLKENGDGDSVSYRAKLPEGTSFTKLQSVSVIDNGTTLLVFVNDILMGKVTLENNVDGIYKKATIYDAAGVEKVKTINAIVPETGLAGFGQRCTLVEIGNYKVYNLLDKVIATAAPKSTASSEIKESSPVNGSSSKAPSPSSTQVAKIISLDKDKKNYTVPIIIGVIVIAGIATILIYLNKKRKM